MYLPLGLGDPAAWSLISCSKNFRLSLKESDSFSGVAIILTGVLEQG